MVIMIHMICQKCDSELSQCACRDLDERLDRLAEYPFLRISPQQMQKYRERARKNKERGSEEQAFGA